MEAEGWDQYQDLQLLHKAAPEEQHTYVIGSLKQPDLKSKPKQDT